MVAILSSAGANGPPQPPKPPDDLWVTVAAGSTRFHAQCFDLSRAGVYLATPVAPPPLRSRIHLLLHTPMGIVERDGEVVRHATAQEAGGWGRPAGFAVEFDRAAGGATPLPQAPLLVVERPTPAPVATPPERTAARERTALMERALREAQAGQFTSVAQCLAAGLTPSELEALEGEFELAHPGRREAARRRIEVARVLIDDGREEQALDLIRAALLEAPLSLALHHLYWPFLAWAQLGRPTECR